MANVEFEEPTFSGNTKLITSEPRYPGIITILIKWGIFKDGKQATLGLIGASIILFGLMIWNFKDGLSSGPNFYSPDNPPPVPVKYKNFTLWNKAIKDLP